MITISFSNSQDDFGPGIAYNLTSLDCDEHKMKGDFHTISRSPDVNLEQIEEQQR